MINEDLIKITQECGLNKSHFGQKCETCLFCCEGDDEVGAP
jgi:hypothetical protein